jgi:hypothetical protein
MIRHDAEREEAHGHSLPRLVENFHESVIVALSVKQGLPGNASIQNVKHVARGRKSRTARHRVAGWSAEGVGSRLQSQLSIMEDRRRNRLPTPSRRRQVDNALLDRKTAVMFCRTSAVLVGVFKMVMNPTVEVFVNTFVQKNRRERAIFELASKSKRGKFLARLCHKFTGVLDPNYLRPLTELGFDPAGLLKHLRKLGAGGTCHVISCNDAVDGKQIPLEDAIHATVGFGLPSILICVPDSLAYFESEQEKGPPPRDLLVKQGRT